MSQLPNKGNFLSTEKQILRIFKEYDVNGDAEIDWEEFRFFAMAALSD
jgi:Ca2+-binding EF-hand superfamily protein